MELVFPGSILWVQAGPHSHYELNNDPVQIGFYLWQIPYQFFYFKQTVVLVEMMNNLIYCNHSPLDCSYLFRRGFFNSYALNYDFRST